MHHQLFGKSTGRLGFQGGQFDNIGWCADLLGGQTETVFQKLDRPHFRSVKLSTASVRL